MPATQQRRCIYPARVTRRLLLPGRSLCLKAHVVLVHSSDGGLSSCHITSQHDHKKAYLHIQVGVAYPGVRHSTAVANLSRHLLELCGWFCFVFTRRSCFSHRRVTISPRPSPLCLSYGLAAWWNLAVLLELSLFLLSLQLAKIFTEVQPPLPGRAASCGSFAHDVDPSGPLRPGV